MSFSIPGYSEPMPTRPMLRDEWREPWYIVAQNVEGETTFRNRASRIWIRYHRQPSWVEFFSQALRMGSAPW